MAKHFPAFHKFLLNYPKGLTKQEAKNLGRIPSTGSTLTCLDVRPTSWFTAYSTVWAMPSPSNVITTRATDYNSMLQDTRQFRPRKRDHFCFTPMGLNRSSVRVGSSHETSCLASDHSAVY